MFRMFGPNPNMDVLRALRVADSASTDRVGLERVEVYSLRPNGLSGKGDQFAWFVEAIPTATSLQIPMTLDNSLLTGPTAARLQFDRRAEYVARAIEICHEFSARLIARELEFYRQGRQSALVAFYTRLAGMVAELNRGRECLLQISWGAGWTAKTVALALDENQRQAIRSQYRLGRGLGPVFPKSRRLEGPPNHPTAPLGWVRIRVEERADGTQVPD